MKDEEASASLLGTFSTRSSVRGSESAQFTASTNETLSGLAGSLPLLDAFDAQGGTQH